MGLNPGHSYELNMVDVRPERYDELRRLYRDDPEALRQIDTCDPNSPYQQHIQGFRNGEPQTKKREEAWLLEHGFLSK